MTTIEK